MTTPESAVPSSPSPGQSARALLKQLEAQFAVFRDCQPLAIGIDKMLRERLPDVDRKLLRMALGMHVNSVRYLRAMEKASARFDLDGQSVADVPDEHRQHASETLRERFRKQAEQKKAQAAADKAKREADEAERLRAEKLAQLSEKFSARRGKQR